MTLSRWHEDLAAHDEAFACLQDLLDPSSFATTVVKAFREWGQGLLRLATALVRENAALERENATLRDRIAELERSAALDSTTSSKPPASDGLRKKSGTQRRTRSQRGKSGRPSGGQPRTSSRLRQTRNLAPRITGSQRVSAPIGVEPAHQVTAAGAGQHADPVEDIRSVGFAVVPPLEQLPRPIDRSAEQYDPGLAKLGLIPIRNQFGPHAVLFFILSH